MISRFIAMACTGAVEIWKWSKAQGKWQIKRKIDALVVLTQNPCPGAITWACLPCRFAALRADRPEFSPRWSNEHPTFRFPNCIGLHRPKNFSVRCVPALLHDMRMFPKKTLRFESFEVAKLMAEWFLVKSLGCALRWGLWVSFQDGEPTDMADPCKRWRSPCDVVVHFSSEYAFSLTSNQYLILRQRRCCSW